MKTGAPSRWPSHCRIYKVLRDAKKPMLLLDICKLAFVSDQRTGRGLNDLRDVGLAHIAAWKRSEGKTGGSPAALWVFGYGVDAEKPAPLEHKFCNRRYYHKRKDQIIARHGEEVWKRIRVSTNRGGADVIARDGRVIYRRQPAKVAA